MKSVSTIDPEARYLDYERVIRELGEAEQARTLDADGVIEKLKEAHDTCQDAADRYTVKATQARQAGDAYIIARGKYLAEIKRRVELPRENRNKLKTPDRPGWLNWCRANGIGKSQADDCITAAAGNMEVVNKRRNKRRERGRERAHSLALARPIDRLSQIKRIWGLLTLAERAEFIQWIFSDADKAATPGYRIRARPEIDSAHELRAG